jgi:hypothetical protein
MKVDRPMIRMVTRKVYLRPIMSPRRPNTSAPKGRTMKPAAKASSEAMNAAVGSSALKNCLAMIGRQRTVQVEVVPLEHRARATRRR